MKPHIKYGLLIASVMLLNGCMDTLSHFWNNGFPMSEKESQAYSQCYAEVRAQDPVMAKKNKTDSELSEFYRRVIPCMKRKGY